MMMTATPLLKMACTRPIMAGLAVGTVLLLAERALSAPLPDPAQAFEKEANTCITVIDREERTQGIPKGLLQAISLAESGRWFENAGARGQAIIAWPWTVTTGGKGHFLPNRADAVAFVESLRADGVENIDVGCMQINLKYHPNAFDSIEEAFDAHANAAYAANFLKERYAVSKSWMQAAGDYHSTTPHLHQSYRLKVSKLWTKTAQADFMRATAHMDAPPASAGNDTLTGTKVHIAQPSQSLTQRFNKAFKMRRAATGYTGAGQEIANRVKAFKPGAHLTRSGGQGREATFTERRQAQLAAWRQSHVK